MLGVILAVHQDKSVAVLIIGHAACGLLLGLAACLIVLACGSGSYRLLASVHDLSTALTLLLSVSCMVAAGSGITAFILISIEREGRA